MTGRFLSGVEDATLDNFYRIDQVQPIDIRVSEDNMRRMLAALPERISVPASFRWRDISLDNVGIRFKGNSSSSPHQRHKRGFLIRFDEYVSHQRFLGLRRVGLDNGVQFGSVFSEPMITEILRDQGIQAPRCNYARLVLNGKYHGLYVNVERIDKSFLEHHLPDPDGLLFKVDEGGNGANLQYLGDDPAAYARTFEPETASARKGAPRLIELLRWIQQARPTDFAAQLASRWEIDDLLRVTAVMLFSGAFDQLTGWNPHNYYLYCDTRQGRWRYLPWDLDVGFCEIAFGTIHVLDDWNAAWPIAGEAPNPLMERIVADPALLQRYRSVARAILEKYFTPERLCALLDTRYALIQDDLRADPFPHQRVTNPGDRDYEDIVASMKTFIRKRYLTARQQLENPGQRPARTARSAGPLPPLMANVQRVMRGAERMQREGRDVGPIQRWMEPVGPLLQQGRTDEAEKRIAAALRLVGEDADAGASEPVLPVVVTARVEPTAILPGKPIPLVVTVANGLPGPLSGDLSRVTLVSLFRDGAPGALRMRPPRPGTAGQSRLLRPGESVAVTSDLRKWTIDGGWAPGKYRAVVRVENLTVEGGRGILSVRSAPFAFEIRK